MIFYFPEESDTYTSWSMTDSYYEYYTDSDTYSSQDLSVMSWEYPVLEKYH